MAKSQFQSWVKQILIVTDINTDICKPHSTRSASSPNVKLSKVYHYKIFLKEGLGSIKLHGIIRSYSVRMGENADQIETDIS